MKVHMNRKQMRNTLAIFLIAVVVRVVYLIFLSRALGGLPQFSDFLYMHQLATSLANGDGFTINGLRIFNQSVGYPAFLSLFYSWFGASVPVALAINCLLGGVSCGLIYVLTIVLLDRRDWLTERLREQLAILASAVAIMYPDSWLYCGLVASENLLIPLLVGLVLINALGQRNEKESGRTAVLAGVATGIVAAAAASVKANAIFYCLFLALQWIIQGRRWMTRTIGAALVGTLCLVPWTVVNYRASGGHIIPFSAVAGTVILDGTNPSGRGKPTNQYHLECEKDGAYTEIELNRLRLRRAISHIKADPVWYAKLTVLKLGHSLSPIRDFVYEHEGQSRLFLLALSRWYPTAFNIFLIVGCVLGLVSGRGQPRLFLSSIVLCAGALLLQAIFCAYSRYRFPFLFALVPVVTYGWGVLFCRILSCIGGRIFVSFKTY